MTDQVRERFETWAKTQGYADFRRAEKIPSDVPTEVYWNPSLQGKLECWQASRNAALDEAAESEVREWKKLGADSPTGLRKVMEIASDRIKVLESEVRELREALTEALYLISEKGFQELSIQQWDRRVALLEKGRLLRPTAAGGKS